MWMNVQTNLPTNVSTAPASTRHPVTTHVIATTATAEDSVKQVQETRETVGAFAKTENLDITFNECVKHCNSHVTICFTVSLILFCCNVRIVYVTKDHATQAPV